jgi:putative oxidoreductase
VSSHGAEIGLLVIRVVVGSLWCGHGSQKLFGWFGGHDHGTVVDEFASFGYRPAWLFGYLAGATELTGGGLLALGLATPVAAGLLTVVSVQATAAVKWRNGPWGQNDGYEYLLVLAAVGVGFAFCGAGRLSLDHAVGLHLSGITAGIVVVVAALLAPLLPRQIGRTPPRTLATERDDE